MDSSSAADARVLAIGGEGACVAYLSCLATATGSVRVMLCDGTRTWSGELDARDLRHPSGTSPDDFRKKLVQGLRSGPSDALAIGPRHDTAELTWKSTHNDGVFDYVLQQAMTLYVDHPLGDGLRTLLRRLVEECTALQRTCGQYEKERAQLQVRGRCVSTARIPHLCFRPATLNSACT